MAAVPEAIEEGFFLAPCGERPGRLEQAAALAEACSVLPAGFVLLLPDGALAGALTELAAERIAERLPGRRLELARGVVEVARVLAGELRPGEHFLDALVESVERLPDFAALEGGALERLAELQGRGLGGLPAGREEARAALVRLAQRLGISLEYLLGNLQKVLAVAAALGVRSATIHCSSRFHNRLSGFDEGPLLAAPGDDPAGLVARAAALERQGVALHVFDEGRFDARLAELDGERLARICAETEAAYGVAEGEFLRFLDACAATEEARLAAAPAVSLARLLACFKFAAEERELVAGPTLVSEDDPRRWRESRLGAALVRLRPQLNWLAASIGIKAAGRYEDLTASASIAERLARLRALGAGCQVTLASGRGERRAENDLAGLDDQALLFDLYCLAVLEKRPLAEVLDAAIAILDLIARLEHEGAIVALDALLAARLAGESYATLLGTQGLVLRDAPVATALEELRRLAAKVELSVDGPDGAPRPLGQVDLEAFRRAVIWMARRLRTPRSPERVLAVITDRIVPELRWLPAAVIAPGPHRLERIVELALAGIPPRYPLRRPWTRLNLDPLVTAGSCLAPGIRNCLGCPVNALYGLVMKAALGCGYEEIITYEATGCFEVYSGIWPYTGKLYPSVHGVFGGAPSEMLGGLAAKRTRARHALRAGRRLEPNRILHLGWGGDGGTFDIGFGNLSGLFSRLQRLGEDELAEALVQRALYVCYDNEGYQNTGNQYSAATSPGGNTTTHPRGRNRPIGNDLRKKPVVEIVAEHGVAFAARANIHRQEHITRLVARALEDGARGAFLHFLQPCTTGWKFAADDLTYELAHLAEEGALFPPLTVEHGIPYLEIYPTPRDPGEAFLTLQARFRHLLGSAPAAREELERVMAYYRAEWQRNLHLAGYDGELPGADRHRYLEEEHRFPRVS